MSKQSNTYVIALIAGLGAAAISFFAPFFPYGHDSASYLDQARNVLTRGVFEATPWGLDYREGYYVPDKLFPPGYPLLIVITSILLQSPAEVVAPFLSLVALILLPSVIVYSFQQVLGLVPALWIGILVTLTPASVRYGYFAYSDLISLVLVIYAINRLLTAGNIPANWFWLGLLTGFCYLLRNANLGLLLTIALYLLWRFIVEPENRKEKLGNGLVWLGANALIIIPWLLRNYLVFGKLQPYSMEPSKVGLGENIHDYVKAQLDTLFAFGAMDELLAGRLWGICLLLILAVMLAQQVMKTWQRWQVIEQKTFFIAVVYVVIGASMVIAARTKYGWGVHIDARYALPFSCFVFVALAIVVKNATYRINTRYLGLGLVVTLLMTRAFELARFYQYDQYNQIVLGVARQIKNNQDIVCRNSDGRFAVSNWAYVYQILCAAPVRGIWSPFRTNTKITNIEGALQEWARFGAERGIVVSLFANGKDDLGSGQPLKEEMILKIKAAGWQVERNDQEKLLLSRKANASP